VNRNLCGKPDTVDDFQDELTSDEVGVEQTELLSRDGVLFTMTQFSLLTDPSHV
jgi:hypothetical protein